MARIGSAYPAWAIRLDRYLHQEYQLFIYKFALEFFIKSPSSGFNSFEQLIAYWNTLVEEGIDPEEYADWTLENPP